jgi:acyl-CoA synthetase (AMP-forming)/AMP-acid ligase II
MSSGAPRSVSAGQTQLLRGPGDMDEVARMDIDGLTPTVPRLLRARAAALGAKRFVVCDDDVLTYEDADRRSAQLARGLLAVGVGRGTHVGLLFPNGSEFLVATLAAARVGAVSLPLSTMSTAHELRGLLRNGDVQLLLAAPSYRSRDLVEVVAGAVPEWDRTAPAPLVSATVPTLRRVCFADDPASVSSDSRLSSVFAAAESVDPATLRAVEDAVRPADRLVIVHTSGSTSEPKAVVHTHGALLRHLHTLDRIRRYDSSEVLFSNGPFFWIGGYAFNVLATLEAGATLVCSNARDAGEVLDLLERERPTLVNGFAASVTTLAEHPSFPERDLSSIRRGNLWPIMPPAARPADPELRHNLLGMTETGSVCLISGDEGDQPEHRRGSFGHVAPGFEARVRNWETGEPCGPGEWGELEFRGPFLMEGYYGRERHETFDPDGWYATGDVVRFDEEGFVYFRARRSEMIKTAGANVSPREVEAAIQETTGLTAHVVGIDDEHRGQIVAVAVVCDDPASLDATQLRARLAERLSPYKIPKVVRGVRGDEIPLMSSGKLDLRALKELLGRS